MTLRCRADAKSWSVQTHGTGRETHRYGRERREKRQARRERGSFVRQDSAKCRRVRNAQSSPEKVSRQHARRRAREEGESTRTPPARSHEARVKRARMRERGTTSSRGLLGGSAVRVVEQQRVGGTGPQRKRMSERGEADNADSADGAREGTAGDGPRDQQREERAEDRQEHAGEELGSLGKCSPHEGCAVQVKIAEGAATETEKDKGDRHSAHSGRYRLERPAGRREGRGDTASFTRGTPG